jgi:membrane protein
LAFLKKIPHAFTRSRPVSALVAWSKRRSMPGFHGIPLYDVLNFLVKQIRTIGIRERAASIAFNFVMALPPSIMFLFTLLPLLPVARDLERSIFGMIRDVVPGQDSTTDLINFLKDFIYHPKRELLSIGFVLSMFFSSNAIMGIMRSFDKNYIGFTRRKSWQKRMTALQITAILFFIVLASTLLLSMQGRVLRWMGVQNTTVRNVILFSRWIMIVFLYFISVSYIYRHAPAVHKKWKMINPGSILATVLMLLLTFIFSWWVNTYGNYNELYGSIGTILILMILIYFNSMMLLIGFELNVSIASLHKIAEERNLVTRSTSPS